MIRFIRFTLLSIFLWLIAGQIIVFHFEHANVKHKVKQMLKGSVPENQLVTFQFNQNEYQSLNWIKSHEFKYQNHLFDVIKKEILPNGTIELKCISDNQETKLFEKLNQTVAIKMANKEDGPFSGWFKLLKIPFLVLEYKQCNKFDIIERKVEYFKYHFKLKAYKVIPDSPPPNKYCF